MRQSVYSMLVLATFASVTAAQSSSLLLSPVRARPTTDMVEQERSLSADGSTNGSGPLFVTVDPKDETSPMTRAIEQVSLYAVPARTPRKFKVEDLVTIIVRQQKKYEADAQLEIKRKWNLMGKLSDWFRFYDDPKHLGTDQLSNGDPGFKFDYDNKNKMEGGNDRKDAFTTRVTAQVVDVKPNGNLVLEATLDEQHDEEKASITVTGTCRSEDVTPDNTVLSTQIAVLRLIEKNNGAVRDATTRGYVPRILSFAGGPF